MSYKAGTYKVPNKTKHFVAVYGSLRPGMSNEGVNKSAGATYIGDGATKDNYNLYEYSNGWFPCVSLKHTSNNTPVIVDVFEVEQTGLEGPYDTLEGFPDFYNRTEVLIKMYNDDLIKAWVYHIDEEQTNLVESGDWVKHMAIQEEDDVSTNQFINFLD